MKNKNIYKLGILSLLMVVTTSCSEDKADRDMGILVNPNEVKISVTPDANDANLFHFKLLTAESQALFECSKAQIKESGIGFTKKILFADTYELKITAYNKAGYIEPVTTSFTVGTTDPNVCLNEDFKLLTGGCGQPEGKTWRLDDQVAGAIGCGDNGSNNNNWWDAGPDNPSAFEDDFTFILNSSMQVISKKTPGKTSGWSFYKDSYGVTWLELIDLNPGYKVTDSQTTGKTRYKLFELTENALHITYYESNGTAWHYFYTSKSR